VSVRRAGYALVGGGHVVEGCDRRSGEGVSGVRVRRLRSVGRSGGGRVDRVYLSQPLDRQTAQDDNIIVMKTAAATAGRVLFALRRRARATAARCMST